MAALAARRTKRREAETKDCETARALAIEASEAGWSERSITAALGFDRATVRKWLGKKQ